MAAAGGRRMEVEGSKKNVDDFFLKNVDSTFLST
jgi:hypothetical protein